MQPGSIAPKTMQLRVTVQGRNMLFLIDSGSSACFLDQKQATQLQGGIPARKTSVKVAGGALLSSSLSFPALEWVAQGHQFADCFRVLALESYDGIVGLDWLVKHSPMTTHWGERWLAFVHQGTRIVLHGSDEDGSSCWNCN